jgi:hypothetical protein
MKQFEGKSSGQPEWFDRNRSILLSRDLLNLSDWVILSCKASRLSGRKSDPGDAVELVSLAVIGPGGRGLLDVLVRPDGGVSSELMKVHGCDAAHVFNAPEFQEVHKILQSGFARTRVVCWSPEIVKATLSRLCRLSGLPALQPQFVDLQEQFSAFVGEKTEPGKGYKRQSLPKESDSRNPGVPPLAECKCIHSLVEMMAGSSQFSNEAAFNKNWSAAFYRPKLGPTEKLKELLGLSDGHRK